MTNTYCIFAIRGVAFYDECVIDLEKAAVIPAFWNLDMQVIFTAAQLGQACRLTVTYSLR
jgi:hypothetical protein